MRWLLDQGLPRGTAALLRQAGHDALHVGDLGMAAAADSSILLRAASEDRIVVTLDADFHALLALSVSSKPSVIRIREEGLRAPALTELLLRIAEQMESVLHAGCMMTFNDGKIRFRSLPIT